MSPRNEAKIIVIGDRFFYGFGVAGRVKTAWTMAGGKMFHSRDAVEPILKRLRKKNINYKVVTIVFDNPLCDCCPF